MKLGFFTMPIHPLDKDWHLSLQEDRAAFLLADELGFTEAYVGEHVTDQAENITSCVAFLAWIAAATKNIRLGTGTINMPNSHPAMVAAQIAMLDHMLDGRLNFGISPGGLMSDAEVFGNLSANRNEMFVECIDTVLKIWASEAPYDIQGQVLAGLDDQDADDRYRSGHHRQAAASAAPADCRYGRRTLFKRCGRSGSARLGADLR